VKYKHTTLSTLLEVEEEVVRQQELWGEQNHPNRKEHSAYTDGFAWQATEWKRLNDSRLANGSLAFDGILLEEVYEAVSESEPARIREELVQVAAVAVTWIAAIDRRYNDRRSIGNEPCKVNPESHNCKYCEPDS
jgi:hypothetical protein